MTGSGDLPNGGWGRKIDPALSVRSFLAGTLAVLGVLGSMFLVEYLAAALVVTP